MSSAKPCLGYPSRTAAVVALRGQRLTTGEIARRIGIEPTVVTALEASAARNARVRKRERELPAWNTVAIDDDTMKALRPHALRREVSVVQLARELLRVLADDGLVDALLDDGRG